MDCRDTHTVTSPHDLISLAARFKDDHSTTHEECHVHIALLKPLFAPELLNRCRNPDSRWMHDGSGKRVGYGKHEYLNLDPLSETWHNAWKLISGSLPRKVRFDISLPAGLEGQDKYDAWNRFLVQDGIDIGIDESQVRRLIAVMATVARMRLGASSIRFELVHNAVSDQNVLRLVSKVRNYLDALSVDKSIKEK